MDSKKINFNEKQLEVIKAFKRGTNRLFVEGGVRSRPNLSLWRILLTLFVLTVLEWNFMFIVIHMKA